MRYLIIVLLLLVMTACNTNNQPNPTPEPTPIPEPVPNPTPEPEPNPDPEPDPEPEPAPPSGSLDESFGEGGKVVLETGGELFVVTTQKDGKIVAAGMRDNKGTFSHFFVTRFKADGSLDESFDKDGSFTTATGLTATDLVVTPENIIHAVGLASLQQSSGGFLDCGLHVRLGPDDSVDDSLKFCASFDAIEGEEIATDSQGRLVSAYLQRNGNELIFSRMDAEGELDESFGNGGKVTLSFPPSEAGSSQLGDELGGLVILPNDQMLLVTSDIFGTPSQQVVRAARFSAKGELITVQLLRLPQIPDDEFLSPFSLTLDNSGRAVVVGGLFNARQSVLLRFDPFSFELDKTFGNEGLVLRPETPDETGSNFFDVVVDKENRIVTVGNDETFGPSSSSTFLVERYLENGTLDKTFGTEGRAQINFEAGATARGVTLDADGKIIVAGSVGSFPALARLNP